MAGLNPTEVAETMELVRKIIEKGITVIMIEHVMKAIMEICDRVIVLHHGENSRKANQRRLPGINLLSKYTWGIQHAYRQKPKHCSWKNTGIMGC